MKTAIIGASAGLGRALAQELAGRGHDLFLLATDARDLDALARDLRLRFDRNVHYAAVSLRGADPSALRREILHALGGLDALFYMAGISSERDCGSLEPELLEDLLEVNFTAGVRLVNALLPDLEASPQGNLVGAGSVATARARKNNSVYAACKAGLEFYFLTQRHRLAATACRVQFYRLGYLRTQMTFGQKLLFPAAEPAAVAKTMAGNLGSDTGAVFVPSWWGGIVAVLRLLPWAVFKRMNF